MRYGQRVHASLRARGQQRAEAEGAAAAWHATCTMNFAVSAWQSADAWACEPTKRQVAESAESAAVGMCMVAALVAAGFVEGVGTAPLLSPEQPRGQIEVAATILSNTNRWQLTNSSRSPDRPRGMFVCLFD